MPTAAPCPPAPPAHGAPTAFGAWEASFAGGLVATSRGVREPWAGGHAFRHDLPEPPAPVRSDPGPSHALVLFTRPTRHAEQRLADGPLLWAGPTRPGELLVGSPALGARPALARWEGRCAFSTVVLDPGTVGRAAEGLGLDYAALEFRDRFLVRDPFLDGVTRALAAEAEAGGPSGRLYAEGLMQAAAAHLVARHTVSGAVPPPAGGLPTASLRRVSALVRADLAADLPLDALAGAAGYSVYHFCRAFRASTGESPHGFVRRLRMEEGARLLRDRPWGVAGVALAVGYASPSRFAAAFRRHHGVAPAAYRRVVRR